MIPAAERGKEPCEDGLTLGVELLVRHPLPIDRAGEELDETPPNRLLNREGIGRPE